MKKSAKQIADEVCETPGVKIKSEGKGRGLATGDGKGPVGIPVGAKRGVATEDGIICETPGEKLKSKGKGRGLLRGRGKGPMGVPVGAKFANYDYLDAILTEAEKRANMEGYAPQPEMPQEQAPQEQQPQMQPPVSPYVDPGQAEEQRRQQLHQQEMQFADDKHNLELQEMQMGMSHGEQDAQLKSDQAQQKAQMQSTKDQEQMQIEQQQQQMQQQAQAQQQAAYSQNIGAMGGMPQQQKMGAAQIADKVLMKCVKR